MISSSSDVCVRKRLAPKGALRLTGGDGFADDSLARQKAPSTIRCIKTTATRRPSTRRNYGQKAPSAKRCIKTSCPCRTDHRRGCRSESTERLKFRTQFPSFNSALTLRNRRISTIRLRTSKQQAGNYVQHICETIRDPHQTVN